jgi:broad specificity phosphatase PhoE
MAARLLLIRSAATAATRRAAFAADEPLDVRGSRAAARLAAVLPRVDQALASPALRAGQTAEAAGLEARPEPDLGPLAAGDWTGLRLDDLTERDPEGLRAWLEDPGASPPGGEGRGELLSRVTRFLDGARGHTGVVAAVTHASVVRAAVILALDAPPQSFWRVDVSPASVTELHPRPTGWLVSRVNWVPA